MSASHQQHHQSEHSSHPSPAQYAKIAVILTVLTAIEVSVFYIPALQVVLLPVLLVLSAAKFVLVVMFYMHLRFDSKLYTGMLCAGLLFAGSLMIAFLAVFGKFAGQ